MGTTRRVATQMGTTAFNFAQLPKNTSTSTSLRSDTLPQNDTMSNSILSRYVGNMSAFPEREEAESHDEEPVVEDHPEKFVEHDEKQNLLAKIYKKGHMLFRMKRSKK
ncbi:hypothetical protein A0J61_08154 [Choanephora cucurbitarum]|uniref:Uncharacterized protein n=1 Tax=Choanephora cucurbitarum TaxID=101091 RepID=A0A1C7N3V3_9FUNG|nr:hypothetical protein A0J61_08154 [Choanephora cucurbitarum]